MESLPDEGRRDEHGAWKKPSHTHPAAIPGSYCVMDIDETVWETLKAEKEYPGMVG